MDHEVTDRRIDARFRPVTHTQANLRPGCTVALVDISAGGALVQAVRPLRPGARVHLQVTTPERRYAIAAHVLRCMVWSLDPLKGVIYRGALRFEERVDWCWAGTSGHGLPGKQRPEGSRFGNDVPVSRLAGVGGLWRGRK